MVQTISTAFRTANGVSSATFSPPIPSSDPRIPITTSAVRSRRRTRRSRNRTKKIDRARWSEVVPQPISPASTWLPPSSIR